MPHPSLRANLCPLLLFVLAAALFGLSEPASASIWFNELRGTPELLPEEEGFTALGLQLTAHVADRVMRPNRPGGPRTIPNRLADDQQPRIVILSASDGQHPAWIVHGGGKGIQHAIDNAIRRLHERAPNRKWTFIKLDVVQRVSAGASIPLNRELNTDPTLVGIAFEEETGIALLPEELVGRHLIASSTRLVPERINAYLKQRNTDPAAPQPHRDDATASNPDESNVNSPAIQLSIDDRRLMYFYFTRAFSADSRGEYELYRGHRVYHEVPRELALHAARQAGDYLRRAVQPDGRFRYLYLPTFGQDYDQYQIRRHAAAAWAMLELYEVTQDRPLLDATRKSLDFLQKQARPMQAGGQRMAAIVENNEVRLGTIALATLAFAKHQQVTGDKRYQTTMTELGTWIRVTQNRDGSFLIHKQEHSTGQVDSRFQSPQYPSQATLALVELYKLDKDRRWLDAAARAAQYMITVRDHKVRLDNVPHDHWLLIALKQLHRHRPNANHLQHAGLIAQSIIAAQVDNPIYPDWEGGFTQPGSPPVTTTSAPRSQGVAAACALLRDFGGETYQPLVPTLQRRLERALCFQLQLQIGPEQQMYLTDTLRPAGGFRQHTSDFAIRIDLVQQNLTALLAYHRLLDPKAQPTGTR